MPFGYEYEVLILTFMVFAFSARLAPPTQLRFQQLRQKSDAIAFLPLVLITLTLSPLTLIGSDSNFF